MAFIIFFMFIIVLFNSLKLNTKTKIGTIFFIIFFLMFLLPIFSIFSSNDEESINNPFDYARITDVDYKAILVDEPNSNGKVVITERLTFDIHAASKNNLFWELWRDLPEDYIDGLKIDYKVNSVKQIYADGTEKTYEESPKLYWDDYDYISSTYGPGKWYHSKGPYDNYYNYECVFFYVDGLYREKVVFEVEYEMNNAALRYNDVSELYLALYSEETIKYLNSFKAQILIPNKDMPDKGNYEVHTYGTNSHSFAYNESKTINPGYHTFSFELDDKDLKFRPYNQYIEFSLLAYNEDRHIFTDYASNNDYYYDNVLEELRYEQNKYESLPEKALKNKIIIFIGCITITILTITNALNKDKKIRKKYNFYKPTFMMQQYFRDIPSNLDPCFAADLVFCKQKKQRKDDDGYSAILLNLIRKKYIELDRINNQKGWTSNNIKIIVKYNPSINSTLEQASLNQSVNSVPTFTNYTYESKPIELLNPIEKLMIPESEIIENNETINYQKYEPLTPNEELYFNLINRHAKEKEIFMDNFQYRVSIDYNNTERFVKGIKNSALNIGISQGYFQKANYQEPKKNVNSTANKYIIIGIIALLANIITYYTRIDFAFGGLFILGIALIGSGIYLKKLAKNYILLTQYGEDEYAKWRGLYNFLNSETLMHEKTVIELPIWEQYLVYATAFGISEKVIKAIQIRCPEANSSEMLSNPYYRSSNFSIHNRSFSSATRSATYTSRSGGYSGSHYGGGGRGGGGGGGGH